MIRVENVSKYFGQHKVLDNINTVFEEGKCNLIIGKSGSGKTVLMKCLVGLIYPDEGYIHFDNRILRQLSKKEKVNLRKDIGMLFQGGALFDSMNVEENVMFPIRMFQKSDYKTMRARVDFCLERVNLSGINKLFPSELSGGMQKRVAIARAIAAQPRYLFCDEPNSGLDPQTSIVIDKLIQEITKEYKMTTVINTHDMNSVMEIGENINFIYEGKLWWKGDLNVILETDNKELNDFIFCSALTKRLKKGKILQYEIQQQ
ncbi:MAG TPA: ATP-binding cassette domain-containing protein [Candidatus Onthomorpha intestinigallinarum]|uniref:ATP-binding cassette domain-containing protein n=1 Tax=Candidatus Onthomorpha intestinigallinarum TaxID=2840880 RepID=A0A9D1RIG1_9BACT|nr:ATP-binding cassette domain-containing protein [Candidatus Onthomorpha intestinigallinarum]